MRSPGRRGSANGESTSTDPKRARFSSILPYVAIEAAVKGVGVILESSVLTEEHVRAGRLVAPLRETKSPLTSYWLVPLRKGARQATIKAHKWLIDQANLA